MIPTVGYSSYTVLVSFARIPFRLLAISIFNSAAMAYLANMRFAATSSPSLNAICHSSQEFNSECDMAPKQLRLDVIDYDGDSFAANKEFRLIITIQKPNHLWLDWILRQATLLL